MTLDELRILKPQILALSDQFGIDNIRIFGSVARGEANADSDVDFLVNLSKPIGFAFAGYVMKLSELLKSKADVVTYKALKPSLKESVFEDAVPL